MGMLEAVKICFQKYVQFSGRASRPEYWYFFLFYILVSIVMNILNFAVLGKPLVQDPNAIPVFTAVDIAGAVFGLVSFLPGLAVTWRRLHDTGRSGWWTLTPMAALPVIVFGAMAQSPIAMGVAGLVYLGLLILLIVWLASRGEPGANRFGMPPSAADNVRAVAAAFD